MTTSIVRSIDFDRDFDRDFSIDFRHNRIVQSPHENYFNVCRQHKEK